jgi:hypothetical protein
MKKETLNRIDKARYALSGVLMTQMPAAIKTMPTSKIRYQCLITLLVVARIEVVIVQVVVGDEW